jgi:hypothetical protein
MLIEALVEELRYGTNLNIYHQMNDKQNVVYMYSGILFSL